MGTMKIIFLDFDGVMNPETFHGVRRLVGFRTEDEDGIPVFAPAAVRNLKYIVDRTGVAIVITSDWRLFGKEAMSSLWKRRNLPGVVLDITPYQMERRGELSRIRGEEIKSWIDSSDMSISAYVIIDASGELHDYQFAHLVKTNAKIGLTRQLAEKAIVILSE